MDKVLKATLIQAWKGEGFRVSGLGMGGVGVPGLQASVGPLQLSVDGRPCLSFTSKGF